MHQVSYKFIATLVFFLSASVFGQQPLSFDQIPDSSQISKLFSLLRGAKPPANGEDLPAYLIQMSSVAVQARSRNDYYGFLLSDVATRFACCASIRALALKQIEPEKVSDLLKALPSITPDLKELNLFSNKLNIPTTFSVIPSFSEIQKVFHLEDPGSFAPYVDGSLTFADLLQKPDYTALLVRILITESLQNQVLPVMIKFTSLGGNLSSIDPSDIRLTQPLYDAASKAAKPSFIFRSGGVAMLRSTALDLTQAKTVPEFLIGYSMP